MGRTFWRGSFTAEQNQSKLEILEPRPAGSLFPEVSAEAIEAVFLKSRAVPYEALKSVNIITQIIA